MPNELTLDRVEQALELLARRPDPHPRRFTARAAVAMVLRFDVVGPRVLLITRARRAGDRWSGQVSLPGGKEEETDAHLLETARRETREEVGLDLDRGGRLLGRLPPVQARARGELLSLSIDPFVFHCPPEPRLRLGPEAVEAFWFPLGDARAQAFDSSFAYTDEEGTRRLPCWRYGERVIWGLTYEMLRRFLHTVTAGGE